MAQFEPEALARKNRNGWHKTNRYIQLLPENKIAWVKNSTEAIEHAKTHLTL